MAEQSLAPTERPKGVKLIEEERWRQEAPPPEGEDWTEQHDDQHESGELAFAAACYAMCSVVGPLDMANNGHLNAWWPWDPKYWKPTDRKRMLVKAGALIAAEIDRLERAAQRETQP